MSYASYTDKGHSFFIEYETLSKPRSSVIPRGSFLCQKCTFRRNMKIVVISPVSHAKQLESQQLSEYSALTERLGRFKLNTLVAVG